MKEQGTIHRALLRHAAAGSPHKAWGYVENGRLHVGTASKHRTRSGVKYNGLCRIWRRTRTGAGHE